jgi:hypothetical protein
VQQEFTFIPAKLAIQLSPGKQVLGVVRRGIENRETSPLRANRDLGIIGVWRLVC